MVLNSAARPRSTSPILLLDGMELAFPGEGGSHGGGGGPKTTREAFEANKASTTRPAPG
jgi:hypothetical protein